MKQFAIVFVAVMLLWACARASAGLVTDNLQLWLKADAITGLNNNDPVSTWDDSSINNRDATQSGAARPTYITGAVNGKPVVRFDGSADYMAVADNNVWAFSDFNMFLVVRISNLSVGRDLIAQDEGPGSTRKWIWGYNTSVKKQNWHINNPGSGSVSLNGTSWTPNTSLYYVIELRKSGSNYYFYQNGNDNGTANSSLAIPNAAALLTIGWAEGSSFLQGDIAELAIYNAALNAADRNQTGWYLGDKYGLPVTYIPEPSTAVLLALGALALLRRRRDSGNA